MADNDIRKEATALMCKSFYTDFMPMIEYIKNDVSALNVSEQNKEAINHINKELEQNNKLIVVVSAQGKTTDKLISEELELEP